MNNRYIEKAAMWLANGAVACVAIWVSQSAAPSLLMLIPFFAKVYEKTKKE